MARDIKSKILARLIVGTYGVDAYIASINATRSESTPVPLQVGTDADSGQYPQVYVDLGDSVIQPAKGMVFDDIIEDFQLEITAVLKGSSIQKLKNDCENYIEAILHCLEGFSEQDGSGSYICEANSIQRADIDTDRDQTVRAVTVTFTVYANQI